MQLTEISFPVATDCVFRNCLVNNFRVFSISCFMRVNFAQCSFTLGRRLGGFDSEVFFFVWKPRTRLPGFVKVFLVFCVDCPQNCMRGLDGDRSVRRPGDKGCLVTRRNKPLVLSPEHGLGRITKQDRIIFHRVGHGVRIEGASQGAPRKIREWR